MAPLGRAFSTTAVRGRLGLATTFAGLSLGALTMKQPVAEASADVDYKAVRETIANMLDVEQYDDGSLGPIFVRLAWHASGTYSCADKTGGSNGATMRFSPECDFGANAGLNVARDVLEKVKAKFPGISYADLWTLAGVVAIEEMGGPTIPWTPGRIDKPNGSHCPPDGRLPDASQGAPHLRDIFHRMGMSDREIVALSGAHTLGRCHTDRSGFTGPWTRAPTTFSNLYFEELLKGKSYWKPKKWNGPDQLEDPTGDLMMLPTDMALIDDPIFNKYVKIYAKDEDVFFKDFSAAFSKLLHLGVDAKSCPHKGSDKSAYTPFIITAGLIALATARGA